MKVRLEKHDSKRNIARYYRMSILPNLFSEWTLYREWGRVGQIGQVRLDLFRSPLEVADAFKSRMYAKQKREYQKI